MSPLARKSGQSKGKKVRVWKSPLKYDFNPLWGFRALDWKLNPWKNKKNTFAKNPNKPPDLSGPLRDQFSQKGQNKDSKADEIGKTHYVFKSERECGKLVKQ